MSTAAMDAPGSCLHQVSFLFTFPLSYCCGDQKLHAWMQSSLGVGVAPLSQIGAPTQQWALLSAWGLQPPSCQTSVLVCCLALISFHSLEPNFQFQSSSVKGTQCMCLLDPDHLLSVHIVISDYGYLIQHLSLPSFLGCSKILDA